MRMRIPVLVLIVLAIPLLMGAAGCESNSQEAQDVKTVQRQQSQYAKGQPVPAFNWSLERDLVIQLYTIRNQRVSTHSVWRSDYGMVEGDCPSMGYGLPYDTSLTNPFMATDINQSGVSQGHGALTSVGQAEPNGVFASTNTAATWVMCIGDGGVVEPHYVESKVSVYPGPVNVDYATNRVTRAGKATVTLAKSAPPSGTATASAPPATP